MKIKKTRKSRLFEGLPVVDATKPLTISVLKEDVKGARKNDPGNCAAARAGKREQHKEVRVFLTRTYIKENKKWVRYQTPESASREIIAFDRGSEFCTGKYTLRPATESNKLGAHRGYSYEGKKELKRNKPNHRTAQVRGWKDRK